MNLHTIARALGGKVLGNQVSAPGPGHSPKDRSLTVKLDGTAPDGFVVFSHAGDDPIACKDYVREKLGLPKWEPKTKSNGHDKTRVVGAYIYRHSDGTEYLKVTRLEPRSFPQYHRENGEWIKGKPQGPKIPYRLPEMLKAVHDVVFVCEGEKDADTLTNLGHVATSASEGAGKWTPELNPWFKGRRVFIMEDNDEAGRKHAAQVAENLCWVAREVRIVSLPGLREKGDVTDWLEDGNDPRRLLEICESSPLYGKGADPGKGLPFVCFDDIVVDVRKAWIIKKVAARGETTGLSGPPGSGKSSLAIDIAVHMALQRDWRGHRAKEKVAALILTFERFDLTVRRLEAYKRKYGLKGLPIAVVRADPINILEPGCVEVLVDTIKEASRKLGIDVGEVIIDTFPKALAAANGDENAAKDQNRSRAHLNMARDRTNVHLTLVGHTGKDVSRGTRGSNAAPGDVDVEIIISGDLVKTATVEKANDQPCGPLTSYRIESYVFGVDEDGDVIDTAIVAGDQPEAEKREGQGGSPQRRIRLDALVEALLNWGQEPPPSFQLPPSITKVVAADKWQEELVSRGELEGNARAQAQKFYQIRSRLVDAGLIGFRDGLVWKT